MRRANLNLIRELTICPLELKIGTSVTPVQGNARENFRLFDLFFKVGTRMEQRQAVEWTNGRARPVIRSFSSAA